MNTLTREDLIVLLTERNETKYAAALNELRNIGNSNLAVTKMYGYSVGDDLVIVYHYCFDAVSYTHLDVYKRQAKDYLYSRREKKILRQFYP